MSNFNFTDFYIKYPGHPRFTDFNLVESDVISVIVQKYEMIIFTNKGDVFGDNNFGGNLEYYLFETKLASEFIESELKSQIDTYISEISSTPYTLTVSFFEDPEIYQDCMEISFKIQDYEVYAIVG